jgi:hypothetical protein
MLADLSPALEVLCPRPRSCAGPSRRGRFAVRDPTPPIPFTRAVVEIVAFDAEGGRFADRDGDEVVDELPLIPFMEVWIFSGRFDLLILQQQETNSKTSMQFKQAPTAT